MLVLKGCHERMAEPVEI